MADIDRGVDVAVVGGAAGGTGPRPVFQCQRRIFLSAPGAQLGGREEAIDADEIPTLGLQFGLELGDKPPTSRRRRWRGRGAGFASSPLRSRSRRRPLGFRQPIAGTPCAASLAARSAHDRARATCRLSLAMLLPK